MEINGNEQIHHVFQNTLLHLFKAKIYQNKVFVISLKLHVIRYKNSPL